MLNMWDVFSSCKMMCMLVLALGTSLSGVAVNNSAAVYICNEYGLLTPSARCSVHASDGTLKRLLKSTRMSE